MDRRTFVTTVTLAPLILPGAALAGAGDEGTPDDVLAALNEGKTVFLDYYAEWCSTCARQERVIEALLAENPAYEEQIAFFALDWDKYKGSDLTKALNIPRRSTLVVLRGAEEFGRIVAGTSESEIKALMDKAMQVAADT